MHSLIHAPPQRKRLISSTKGAKRFLQRISGKNVKEQQNLVEEAITRTRHPQVRDLLISRGDQLFGLKGKTLKEFQPLPRTPAIKSITAAKRLWSQARKYLNKEQLLRVVEEFEAQSTKPEVKQFFKGKKTELSLYLGFTPLFDQIKEEYLKGNFVKGKQLLKKLRSARINLSLQQEGILEAIQAKHLVHIARQELQNKRYAKARALIKKIEAALNSKTIVLEEGEKRFFRSQMNKLNLGLLENQRIEAIQANDFIKASVLAEAEAKFFAKFQAENSIGLLEEAANLAVKAGQETRAKKLLRQAQFLQEYLKEKAKTGN